MLAIAIKELEETFQSIDVICLSETFVQEGDERNISLENYMLGSHWSRPNARRGGVCVLVKKNMHFVKLDNISKELSAQNVFECCGVSFPRSNLIIICVYTTPSSDTLVFLNTLESLLYRITKKKK